MANPQPTDAHLRIAHQISEQLMVSHFTAKQRRILDLILRLSWGCGKKDALIPLQRDFEVIGIGEGHIKSELDILIRDKVIERAEDSYWFNKDFDKWRVSRARGYSQDKLTELVSMNLKNLPNREVEGDKNLPKREVRAYRNGKLELTETGSSSDTKLATSKEITKESIKQSVSLSIEDVYEVYKKEIIGSLDESVSIPEDIEEDLKLTVGRFSAPWVIDAIREGLKHKRRDWNYIVGILRNWEREEREAKSHSNKGPRGKQDPDKYIKGKYGHMVQR